MSKATILATDKKALAYIKEAVDLAYNAVKVTLGRDASTTLMYRTFNRGPRFADDGYWTLHSITPKNPFVRLAYEAFKEATAKTNEKCGDGTSGTTVFGGALFNDIYAKTQAKLQGYSSGKTKNTNNGALRREILAAAKDVKEQIRKSAKDIKSVDELKRISAISFGEKNETSDTIADMAWQVGVDGFIDVVEGYKGEIETEVIKGLRFPAKACGKVFVNRPERHEMVIEDTPVFITNHKLDNDMLARFVVAKLKTSKLVIIAPDFAESVLVNMVLSRENGTFIWPIKAPSLRTEQMEDIAVFCDAKLVNKDEGMKLENISGAEAGLLQKIIVKDVETREDVVALGGRGEKGNAVKERIQILQGQLTEAKEPQFKKILERRIASLASVGGVIRVGSPTDAESLPLKLKVEDDVFACKAALKSGYVKGGGLCLKEIADKLEDGHVLKRALMAPYNQIQENAGGSLEIGKDVIDPADAVFYQVEHGASVVSSLISVKNLVAEEPEMQLGEGQLEIAKAISAFAFAWKKKEGMLSASEKAAEADRNGGLSDDEVMMLDTG